MACKRSAVRSRLAPPKFIAASPSSRGPGHRPFTAVTGVRIPLGTPIPSFSRGILMTLMERITIEPGKRSGQPCIRGLRITVWDVLNWLAGGMSESEILEEYPELHPEDFRAVYEYAARLGKRVPV